MKEMLARHKGKLILSSLVILLPILPAAFAGQTLFLWEPVLLLVSQWVIMLVVLHANRNKEQSPKVLNLVAWILPVLSLLLGVVGQLAQGGADSAYLITALFTFFMGLLFFLIGNYMPKTKQNGAVGIRIKWTLESEENWDAIPPLRWEALVPGRPAADGLRPHPQRADGDSSLVCHPGCDGDSAHPLLLPLLQEPGGGGQGGETPRQAPEYRPDCGACPGVRRFPGLVPVQRGHPVCLWDGFPHRGRLRLGDLTIPYSSVTSLEYFEQDPSQDASGFRTNGLGNFKVALGSFENDLYGDYTRYTFASCGACVVLESDGRTIVLNAPDAASTQELYQSLLEKTGLG